MKPIPDCIPEALWAVLEAARVVSDDPFIHRKVLRRVMKDLVKESDFGKNAAEVHFRCLTAAYKALGVKDPYENEKARRNKAMLGLEATFRDYLDVAPDRLSACINLVLAGSLNNQQALGRAEMEREILEQLDVPRGRDDRKAFTRAIQRAETVMYVLDSAGEIVLDKLLIEEIGKRRKVTAVVASKPILLSATAEDAKAVHLDEIAEIIDPGAPMLGLIREWASSSFREAFASADVVIVKGETHYQTLTPADREIFFLFHAHGTHVAEELSVPVDSTVFAHIPGKSGATRPATRNMEAVSSPRDA